jgi:hypothetical protein
MHFKAKYKKIQNKPIETTTKWKLLDDPRLQITSELLIRKLAVVDDPDLR